MAYKVPTFNSFANVWHGQTTQANPVGAPDLLVQCQLRWCGRGPTEALRPNDQAWQQGWQILFPKLTDIRDVYNAALFDRWDTIEAPAGSGRYYGVQNVDDVGKGFTNEYRIAYVHKIGVWPTPIP